MELHVAACHEPDTNQVMALETLIAIDELGPRVGNHSAYRAGEILRQDLIDAGDWDEAVSDALRVMAMDWRIMDPAI